MKQFIEMTSSPSSHRQSMSFLVSQNNQGLTHLKNGNIIGARKCFIDALQVAQIGQLKKVNTFSNAANATTAVTTTLPLPSSSTASGCADSPFNGINNNHCGNKNTRSSDENRNQEGNPSPLQEISSSSLSPRIAPGTVNPAVAPESITSGGESNRKRKNSSTTTTTTTGEGDFTAAASVVPSSSTTTTKRRRSNSNFREELFSRLQTLPTTSRLQDQGISIFMDLSQQQHPAYSANIALIYSVIIYNMGLAYHIRGRQCQNRTLLCKAMDMYDKAHSIVLVELVAAPVVRTDFDNDIPNDEQYQQHQQSSSTPTLSSSTSSTSTTRRISLMKGLLDRNPIVDLLRLSLLKQMADIQKSLSNFQAARNLAEEISAFIMSVENNGGGGGEFIYRDSRVTELMQIQVGCFLMYSFSLKQGLVLAAAA